MVKQLVSIEVGEIYQHPDNPRKDLGDISELSESIRKNGVKQNLTVIPGHFEDGEMVDGGFTLIIGHRRLAAAKEAGLDTVPCIIAENMDVGEQVSTMLEENMHRKDLSIIEQAGGFQMMLDFGETEGSIAEKTGFSKRTVKHRVNLAKLDQEALKEKTEKDGTFQLNITDLYELEKIESIDERNKILQEARDSRDLIWRVQASVKEKIRKERQEKAFEMLREMGLNQGDESISKNMWSGKWKAVYEQTLDDELPEAFEFDEDPAELYYIEYYGRLKVMKAGEQDDEDEEMTPEEMEREQRDNDRQELNEIFESMNRRRRDFVENIVNGKITPLKDTQKIMEMIIEAIIDLEGYMSKNSIVAFAEGKPYHQLTPEEREDGLKKAKELAPLHKSLICLDSIMGNHSPVNWMCMYSKSTGEKIVKANDIFEMYGWSLSKEEDEMLYGMSDKYRKDKEEDLDDEA